MSTRPTLIAALIATASLVGIGCEEESSYEAEGTAPAVTDETEGTVADGITQTEIDNATEGAVDVATGVEVQKYDDLHDLMEEVEDQYKYLRRNLAEGEQAELIERATVLKLLMEQATTITPAQVTEADTTEKSAELQAAYEKHNTDAIQQIDALIEALAKDDRVAADAALKLVHDAEEAGHEALDVDH